MTKFHLRPKAEFDYFNIYAYSAANFGAAQAELYTSGLLDAFTVISEHRHIGQNIGHMRAGYFRYEYKRHSIFYRLEGDNIVIVRILGSQQNAPGHL